LTSVNSNPSSFLASFIKEGILDLSSVLFNINSILFFKSLDLLESKDFLAIDW
jgi:hypothetical protein